ncbi:hypothetical protein B0H10DRAFT_1292578 [Mycena sp. CBHHK59/15]|nr:hypothetical protein B0H10DRAFT_1292578 [Mycena sp. CBHHK59/15]
MWIQATDRYKRVYSKQNTRYAQGGRCNGCALGRRVQEPSYKSDWKRNEDRRGGGIGEVVMDILADSRQDTWSGGKPIGLVR